MQFPFTILNLDNNLSILRDDLIEGGTKRRGLSLLLNDIKANRIGYAGTVFGHGALALAHACHDHGKSAEIFISAESGHPMVRALKNAKAIVHSLPPMPIAAVHNMAQNLMHDGVILPPGFDMPEFQEAMIQSLKDLDLFNYSEIWTVRVSGTLSRALISAFPCKSFKIVSVVKSGLPTDFNAPERYHRKARNPPPYPACPYTDAKLWQFVILHAAPGALIWNTAG